MLHYSVHLPQFTLNEFPVYVMETPSAVIDSELIRPSDKIHVLTDSRLGDSSWLGHPLGWGTTRHYVAKSSWILPKMAVRVVKLTVVLLSKLCWELKFVFFVKNFAGGYLFGVFVYAMCV